MMSELLERHENAGTILKAFHEIEKYRKEALEEIKNGDKNKGYADLAILNEKRNKAKKNYTLYVQKTIDILKTI